MTVRLVQPHCPCNYPGYLHQTQYPLVTDSPRTEIAPPGYQFRGDKCPEQAMPQVRMESTPQISDIYPSTVHRLMRPAYELDLLRETGYGWIPVRVVLITQDSLRLGRIWGGHKKFGYITAPSLIS